jgi:hypothetical protein
MSPTPCIFLAIDEYGSYMCCSIDNMIACLADKDEKRRACGLTTTSWKPLWSRLTCISRRSSTWKHIKKAWAIPIRASWGFEIESRLHDGDKIVAPGCDRQPVTKKECEAYIKGLPGVYRKQLRMLASGKQEKPEALWNCVYGGKPETAFIVTSVGQEDHDPERPMHGRCRIWENCERPRSRKWSVKACSLHIICAHAINFLTVIITYNVIITILLHNFAIFYEVWIRNL